MKVELNDHALTAVFVTSLLLAAVSATAISLHYYTVRTEAAFAAGYELASVPGCNGTHWVKIKNK